MRTVLTIFLLFFAAFSSADETRGRFPEKMVVTVVDEAGNPIPHANGFHRFGKYVNFNVDENGVFEIPIVPEAEWTRQPPLDFSVKAEGYGPFEAAFEQDPIIPDTFTVVLKPAQKIGGIVVDEEGNPVKGVEISLSIDYETSYKTPEFLVAVAETKTDADGKWSIFQLPATFNGSPRFSLSKEGYLSTPVYGIPASRLNPDAAGRFNEKITIESGYTFSGKVVDDTGTSIEGAVLQMGEGWGVEATVTTEKDGAFLFANRPLSDQTLLTVRVPGKAAQVLLVEVRSKNEPMEIVMQPGRKLTFEVSDSAGKPIKDVGIRVAGINGLPGGNLRLGQFLHDNDKTDENGRFVWNEAPTSSCDVVCFLHKYIEVRLHIEPDQETIPVKMYGSLVKLHVLDAETEKPIPTFFVSTKAYGKPEDERAQARFSPDAGSAGTIEVHTRNDDNRFRAWQFDVQAPDYEPVLSRKIVLGEENVSLEVRMKPAPGTTIPERERPNPDDPRGPAPEVITRSSVSGLFPLSGGTILTPDGQNATKATVEVAVKDLSCGPNAQPIYSDDDGKFLLSDAQHAMIGPQEFVLKITHASGAAVVDGNEFRNKHNQEDDSDAEPIRLAKWGRIEGTIQAGDRKLEGTGITIRWVKPDALPVAPMFYQGTRTKKDGRFVFEQVMPGKINVTRDVPARGIGSSWSSYCDTVEVKPGETTVCVIGGTGRSVVGKVIVSKTIDFTQYTARLVVKPEDLADLISPELPKEYWPDPFAADQASCNLKRLAWNQTDEGREYQRRLERNNKATRNLRFSVLKRDGTFRFDDLPAGDYALMISVTDNCGMDFGAGEYYVQSVFTVDDVTETPPLDLDELVFVRKE